MNSKSPIFTAQSDVALRIHVDRAVRHYFAQLQGEQPSQVYDMVLAEMEKPLLSVVLEYTRGKRCGCSTKRRCCFFKKLDKTRGAAVFVFCLSTE